MKRAIPLAALLIVAAGTFAVMKFGGCNGGGSANTRIAQRKLYTGPSTLPVDAGDWPRWLGPYGDNISREPNLAPEWPKGGLPMSWAKQADWTIMPRSAGLHHSGMSSRNTSPTRIPSERPTQLTSSEWVRRVWM